MNCHTQIHYNSSAFSRWKTLVHINLQGIDGVVHDHKHILNITENDLNNINVFTSILLIFMQKASKQLPEIF